MANKDTDILLLNRSFWPDIEATGQLLTELCEQLAKRYKVTVIAGRSYYVDKEAFGVGGFYRKEIFNGINILRVRHTRFWKKNLIGRIINWLTYSILAFVAASTIKPKIIIVCTDPPFLGIIGMIIRRLKSVPFVYNCRDLFPDVAVELGRLKKSAILACAFDYLNKKAFASASYVICLGQSMKNRIKNKKIANLHIKVIPDWVDIRKVKPVPKNENPLLKKFGLEGKFVIIYSGNIGLSQDFSMILQAGNMIKDKTSFCLIFIGEGSGKQKLKSEASLLSLKNVIFLPYQPQDMLSFSLGIADIHLITIRKGLAGAIVPSKIYGIMAAGRPYLAVVDKESEAARFAEEFGCGLWAPTGDLEMIAQKISWAVSHPKELEEMGKRGRDIAEKKFDKNLIIKHWLSTLEKLEEVWYA